MDPFVHGIAVTQWGSWLTLSMFTTSDIVAKNM
jgi:hypothetical protein